MTTVSTADEYGAPLMLRRLFPAPDDGAVLLATCSQGCVPVLQYHPSQKSGGSAMEVVPDAAGTSPRVSLPFPATTLAWCPFKSGTENASFLTACRSQPLQLWDLSDGELRGSYVAYNNSGVHASPHCVQWLEGQSNVFIAGGYGNFEDRWQVRVFDVLREGESTVWTYRSASARGPVCSLTNHAIGSSTPLLAAGFLQHGSVELLDRRNRCPAALLRGLRSGVGVVRGHPTNEFFLFAGGRCGEDRILCWDLRRPCQALAQYHRHVHTHQVCDYAFVKGGSGETESYRLVSASTAGGVVVFDDLVLPGTRRVSADSEAAPVTGEGRVLHAEIGVTSGLAALSDGKIAVVTGTRHFDRAGRHPRAAAAAPSSLSSSSAHGQLPHADNERRRDEEEGEEENDCGAGLYRKRPRPAMSDTDSDEEPAVPVAITTTGHANVAVLSV